jgi:putative transposase
VSTSRRQSMVAHDHDTLGIVRQCLLLKISRSGLYYRPRGESSINLDLMQEIDRAFIQWPFMGVRRMRNYLRLLGYSAGVKRVRRLMGLMGLMPIYPKPEPVCLTLGTSAILTCCEA